MHVRRCRLVALLAGVGMLLCACAAPTVAELRSRHPYYTPEANEPDGTQIGLEEWIGLHDAIVIGTVEDVPATLVLVETAADGTTQRVERYGYRLRVSRVLAGECPDDEVLVWFSVGDLGQVYLPQKGDVLLCLATPDGDTKVADDAKAPPVYLAPPLFFVDGGRVLAVYDEERYARCDGLTVDECAEALAAVWQAGHTGD